MRLVRTNDPGSRFVGKEGLETLVGRSVIRYMVYRVDAKIEDDVKMSGVNGNGDAVNGGDALGIWSRCRGCSALVATSSVFFYTISIVFPM